MIKRFLRWIAGMSRRASVIYSIVLTLIFLVGICLFLAGILYILPDVTPPDFAIPCLAVGSLVIVLVLATVAVTTMASNFASKDEEEESSDAKDSSR